MGLGCCGRHRWASSKRRGSATFQPPARPEDRTHPRPPPCRSAGTALSYADVEKPFWAGHRTESPISTPNSPPGVLNLSDLLDLGQDVKDFESGEVRLIGWSNDDLPGLTIKPAAPQAKRGILVIAHLRFGLGEAPRPDENLKSAAMQ